MMYWDMAIYMSKSTWLTSWHLGDFRSWKWPKCVCLFRPKPFEPRGLHRHLLWTRQRSCQPFIFERRRTFTYCKDLSITTEQEWWSSLRFGQHRIASQICLFRRRLASQLVDQANWRPSCFPTYHHFRSRNQCYQHLCLLTKWYHIKLDRQTGDSFGRSDDFQIDSLIFWTTKEMRPSSMNILLPSLTILIMFG